MCVRLHLFLDGGDSNRATGTMNIADTLLTDLLFPYS